MGKTQLRRVKPNDKGVQPSNEGLKPNDSTWNLMAKGMTQWWKGDHASGATSGDANDKTETDNDEVDNDQDDNDTLEEEEDDQPE